MIVEGDFGMRNHEDHLEEVHVAIKEPESLASGKYKDDITGQVLVDSLVGTARKLELEYVEDKRVWDLRDKVGCFRNMGEAPSQYGG